MHLQQFRFFFFLSSSLGIPCLPLNRSAGVSELRVQVLEISEYILTVHTRGYRIVLSHPRTVQSSCMSCFMFRT